VDGHQGVGPGDRFIAKALLGAKQGTPVVCVVNKCDRLRRSQTAAALAAAAELEAVDELFPISARTGAGLEPLIVRLASLLPEGPFAYPPEDRSDLPSEVHLAELVREQVLRRTREEIPHAVEVAVEEVVRRKGAEGGSLIEVHAQIWVETQSQKGILVGKGGRMVREIGTAARKELERDLGAQVFLNLQVKVREHWRRDDALLDRIGIE
jgi:GTPase